MYLPHQEDAAEGIRAQRNSQREQGSGDGIGLCGDRGPVDGASAAARRTRRRGNCGCRKHRAPGRCMQFEGDNKRLGRRTRGLDELRGRKAAERPQPVVPSTPVLVLKNSLKCETCTCADP